MDQPNPFDALSRAGDLVQGNIGACLGVGFIYLIVSIALAVPSVVVEQFIGEGFGAGSDPDVAEIILVAGFLFITWLMQMLVGAVLNLGLGRFALRLVDEGTAEVGDIIPDIDQVLHAIVAGFASSVVVTLGLMLCCVGVFAAYPCTLFWSFFLVDRRGNGLQAVGYGVQLVRGNLLPQIMFGGLIMVLAGFNAVLCCYIPSVIVIPFIHVACALVYRQTRPVPVLLEER
tara:strand:+ start:286 stop:975 length:690 start_codon:yes stop_codon:yes gene_type:complete